MYPAGDGVHLGCAAREDGIMRRMARPLQPLALPHSLDHRPRPDVTNTPGRLACWATSLAGSPRRAWMC